MEEGWDLAQVLTDALLLLQEGQTMGGGARRGWELGTAPARRKVALAWADAAKAGGEERSAAQMACSPLERRHGCGGRGGLREVWAHRWCSYWAGETGTLDQAQGVRAAWRRAAASDTGAPLSKPWSFPEEPESSQGRCGLSRDFLW